MQPSSPKRTLKSSVAVLLVTVLAFFSVSCSTDTANTSDTANVGTQDSTQTETRTSETTESATQTTESAAETTESAAEGTTAETPTAESAPEAAASEEESDIAVVTEHKAKVTYLTPRRDEHEIEVTLTLDGPTITAADVSYDGGGPKSPNHESFDTAFEDVVIGQDVSDLSVSRVGGASLTSDAFNEAVEAIRANL